MGKTRFLKTLAVVMSCVILWPSVVLAGEGDTGTSGALRYDVILDEVDGVEMNVARVLGLADGHQNDTSISIPATVVIKGTTYKVHTINSQAFSDCTNIKTIDFS